MDIIETLETIKYESKTNEKIKLLRACKDRKGIIELLNLAYNKKIKFNLKSKSLPKIHSGIYDDIPFEMFEELQKVSGRGNKIQIIKEHLNGCRKEVIFYCKNILDKDLGIGISIKTINKAFGENTIEDFKVQLAFKVSVKRYELAFKELEWVYANVKIDGIRCVANVKDVNNITFTTRNGLPIQPFLVDNIKKDIVKNIDIFKGRILDGEIHSRHFQKLMRIVSRKNVNLDSIKIRNSTRFTIFDLIDEGDKHLINRVGIMEELSTKVKGYFIKFVKYFKVKNDFKLIYMIAEKYIKKGQEGIIIKHPFVQYEFKRSNNWLKFKDEQSLDLKIIKYFEGENGTKYEGMLGGIILDYQGSELRCGSGFTDKEREEYWNMKEELIGRIAEIVYMEMTQTGSLRHPVFKRFRMDKEILND